jgi:DNA repair exonuclease SbcCD ATPase subunit
MAGHSHDPHIICPKCSHQIPLTESIATPLLEAERRDFQKQLASRDVEFASKADELRRQQLELVKAREGLEEQVKQRLHADRKQIVAAEATKAREQVAGDLDGLKQRLAENEQLLEERNLKLAEAQQAQAEAMRKQRELDEKPSTPQSAKSSEHLGPPNAPLAMPNPKNHRALD